MTYSNYYYCCYYFSEDEFFINQVTTPQQHTCHTCRPRFPAHLLIHPLALTLLICYRPWISLNNLNKWNKKNSITIKILIIIK